MFFSLALALVGLGSGASDHVLRAWTESSAEDGHQVRQSGRQSGLVIKYDTALLQSLGFSAILSPLRIFYDGSWHMIHADSNAELTDALGADGGLSRRTQIAATFTLAPGRGSARKVRVTIEVCAETGRIVFAQQFLFADGEALKSTNYRSLDEVTDLDELSPLPQAWFPAFEKSTEGEASPWRHLLWSGCQINEVLYGHGVVPSADKLGYHSAPLVFFRDLEDADSSGTSMKQPQLAILSHVNHFKNAVMSSALASFGAYAPSLALGLSGELTSVPAGTVYSAVLYPGETGAGITETMYAFGRWLGAQQAESAGKDFGTDLIARKHANRLSDITLTHLGFWTDNGAQFYGDSYNTKGENAERGHGREYNLTCCTQDKIEAAMKRDPVVHKMLQYVQLDDWWYVGVHPVQPKPEGLSVGHGPGKNLLSSKRLSDPDGQWGVKCVEKWRWPAEYRSGDREPFSDYAQSHGLMLYGPYLCTNNTHAAEFEWVKSGNVVTPRGVLDSHGFYHRFFKEALDVWPKFQNFEIDFMNDLFLRSREYRETLGLYEQWLAGVDRAAAHFDIKVQYCMMLPSDIFVSMRMPHTTNGRASDDYAALHNWDVSRSSLLFDGLGPSTLRPSKDNFWTSSAYPRDANFVVINENGGDPALNLDLHSLVALNSLGPVGPSDMLLNATLLQRCARSDGLLLRPDRPMVQLDRWWAAGDAGRVAASSMRVGESSSARVAYNVLVANTSTRSGFSLRRRDLYPRVPQGARVLGRDFFEPCSPQKCRVEELLGEQNILEHFGASSGSDSQRDSGSGGIVIPFRYLHLYAAPASDAVVFLGETGKYAPLAAQRFSDVSSRVRSSDGITILSFKAALAAGEAIEAAYYVVGKKAVGFATVRNGANVEKTVSVEVKVEVATAGSDQGETTIAV